MKTAIIFNDSGYSITRRSMGAYKIANMLRNDGWTVEVIDWLSYWDNHELLKFVEKFPKVDLFAFGILWMTDEKVVETIDILKNHSPGSKFLLGGPRPYQQDYGADVMIFGYAEHALKPVIDYMFNGGPKPIGSYLDFAPKSLMIDANKDYTALEIPNYFVDYHPRDFVLPSDVLTLEMTRGCRFKCKYCSYAFLGIKEDYSRSEESIYQEIMTNYSKWGTTNYIIADDTFNDRDEKIERLAKVVERLPFEPNFTAFIRLDLVLSRPKQLDLLIRSRVWGHFYGIETFHPLAAKAIGKGMDPEKIKDGLLFVKDRFMSSLGYYRGTCGMIAGLPYEPVESWHNSLDWMNKNWDCYLFWGLHISTDPTINTHSLFSQDSAKYGYTPTQNKEIIEWAREKGFLDVKSSVTHKLDKHIMVWEADWANFKQATEFSEYYNKNFFPKIKVPNFELLNYWGRSDMLSVTAEQAYIKKELKDSEIAMINNYKNKKLT